MNATATKRGPAPHSRITSAASANTRRKHYQDEAKRQFEAQEIEAGRRYRINERMMGEPVCALAPAGMGEVRAALWMRGYLDAVSGEAKI